jgi:hypothetical protein
MINEAFEYIETYPGLGDELAKHGAPEELIDAWYPTRGIPGQ